MRPPFPTIQQDIQVSFRYPVHFTRDLFAVSNPLVRNIVAEDGAGPPAKLLVVLDRGVHRCHPRLLSRIEAYCRHHHTVVTLAGAPLLFEGGEQLKNDPRHVKSVQQAIHTYGLCRHSYVAAIGGGALIDMAGFAAATAHRGLRLIRVPTTVMAQADAAIGVKNGINAFGKKNFIGTFAPPVAVLNDASFLPTLSRRDWIGGVAEAVKVALIKDSDFFTFLEQHAEPLAHLKAAAGQLIHLDLEPEPDGLLSASREVADFFRHWLLQLGAPVLAEHLGMSAGEAHQCLLEHIRVCLDTCHLAVEYEDPATALNTLAEAGVRVGKVQITAGLKVELPAAAGLREAVVRDLETFTHSPYLHQVIGQTGDGRRVQFPDLAPALPHLTAGLGPNCRIHYHMPLFVDRYRHLASTGDDTRAVLALLKDRGFSRHLEIETYTWEWLPPDLKTDLLESLHREYLWVLEEMGFVE